MEPAEAETIWVSHYSNKQHILLVGEGDFSFSSCLATRFGVANRLIATSLDSKEELDCNYGKDAAINTSNLVKRGAHVLHGCDARHMATKHSTPLCTLKQALFDRIVFNFPHAGFPSKKTDHATMVQKHSELVRLFFANAACMLLPGGEVHVSHKDGDTYDEWKLEEQAELAGLALVKRIPFEFDEFPGYGTRREADKEAGRRFPLGTASTYIFAVSDMDQVSTYVILNNKTELTLWNSVMPELVDLKAKLIKKGQASTDISLLQVLVDEVRRLEKVLNELGKKKAVKLQQLNSALKEVILHSLQLKDPSLSALTLVDTTSRLPMCLRCCEFCEASLAEPGSTKAESKKNSGRGTSPVNVS